MNRTRKNESLATATMNDPRWAAVVARDPDADGKFFYSVRTTGVYCRPSCGARVARPENVHFHATAADAERAGFRPASAASRTRLARGATRGEVAELCRFIEGAERRRRLTSSPRQPG